MIRLSALAASLLTLAVSAACSQTPPPYKSSGMTLDRFLDRQTGRIMAAETDGDGRVSRAEMAAMTTRSGRDPSRRFDRMDANHDGYLDAGEIRAALTRRFRHMDRDGDGMLTPDERMAGRMRAQPQQPSGAPAAPQP